MCSNPSDPDTNGPLQVLPAASDSFAFYLGPAVAVAAHGVVSVLGFKQNHTIGSIRSQVPHVMERRLDVSL